jgi:hypothetical protein
MAECDSDREDVRPLPRRHAIERTHELGEEIVEEQFLDDQLHERARPRQRPGARGEQAHRARTKLVPPVFGVELVFSPGGFFEVVVDVDHGTLDLAHGSPPTTTAIAFGGVPTIAEGL